MAKGRIMLVAPRDSEGRIILKPGTYYSADEVAETLGVSRSHVYRLVAAGELHGVDVGAGVRRRMRFAGGDILAFLTRRGLLV